MHWIIQLWEEPEEFIWEETIILFVDDDEGPGSSPPLNVLLDSAATVCIVRNESDFDLNRLRDQQQHGDMSGCIENTR